ncbi:unnamed protein product [Caenorhabditis sp. 36 PRJEB53466]|nr:unnamed protein product [Caenorhabditis sp. 36 PRJEB53466]
MANRACVCQVSAAIIFLIGLGLLVAGLVVVLGVFPNIVHNQINDGKVLGLNDDGTLNSFTDSWVNSKYISTMQYWIFNYTNTIGIMNRALYPDVMEKGPYAYDEILTMDMVNFTENGEFMQFRQIQTFVFNPNKSCPDCDPYKDKVLIPDIGFQVGIDQIDSVVEALLKNPLAQTVCQTVMKARGVADPEKSCANLGALVEGELGTLISLFNVSPFTTVTVDQLVFSGYKTPFVDKFVNEALAIFHFLFDTPPQPIDNPPIQLNPLNGTSDVLNTVLTGKTDPLQAGYMTEFSSISNNSLFNSIGNTLPPQWWPYANKTYCKDPNYALSIRGTNGDYFKNFVKKTDVLPAFVSDICRSIDFVFDREVTVRGFKGYRFVMPPTQFDYSLDENCGFCIPLKYGAYEYPAQSACLPSGLLDISGCSGGPIIMSKPHFYQSSKVVSKFVPRFRPTYDNDETMLDIEPNTGTVLQAMKRLQINMLVNQYKHIRSYSVMRPGAYPLAWVNESFYMDQNTVDQLNSQLFNPVSTVNTICWIAVGLGSGLIALSIVMFYIEPAQKLNPTYVQQLVEGSLKRVQHGMNLTSSVSMVYDGGHYIVVDSPSATDVHSKELMLKGVASRNIAPGEIQYVVTTHGHPDHFGQGNFFPNARHFFGSYEYSDTNFISTELHTKDIMQLTKNVQLWNTPGHTAQDVTVMVHNVSCCGVIAVAEAWNPIIGKISRNKVICYADYVIPGHGKLFRVTHDMKTAADCFTKYETNPEENGNESQPQFENNVDQNAVIRKPAETLFSSANSLSSNYIRDPTTVVAEKVQSSTHVSEITTTSQFYTVDLTAETPTIPDSELIFDVQENLPPLGMKIKKNINYIEVPDLSGDVHPMVQSLAKRVSEVLKPQNDTELAKMMPQFKKWQTTLIKLWDRYMHAN